MSSGLRLKPARLYSSAFHSYEGPGDTIAAAALATVAVTVAAVVTPGQRGSRKPTVETLNYHGGRGRHALCMAG